MDPERTLWPINLSSVCVVRSKWKIQLPRGKEQVLLVGYGLDGG